MGKQPDNKLTYSSMEGYETADGSIRIYGYSEPPPQPQCPTMG